MGIDFSCFVWYMPLVWSQHMSLLRSQYLWTWNNILHYYFNSYSSANRNWENMPANPFSWKMDVYSNLWHSISSACLYSWRQLVLCLPMFHTKFNFTFSYATKFFISQSFFITIFLSLTINVWKHRTNCLRQPKLRAVDVHSY